MSKIFVIDVSRCSGCMNCQLACKDEHCENDWLPYAAAQPLTGQFWCRVREFVHGTMPKVKLHYEPRLCGHCPDAPCMASCAPGAIYRREDGLVLIDPEKCTGCKECLAACPHDAVFFSAEKGIAQKCTGCAHLLDNGHALPRCAEACPTDALRFGDEADFAGELDGALRRGNVYYLNLPGRFIAGTVYDPDEKEIIEGASCRLFTGSGLLSAVTDDMGDFWFKNLPESELFSLMITADGYESATFDALDTENDINLGDIPLKKE